MICHTLNMILNSFSMISSSRLLLCSLLPLSVLPVLLSFSHTLPPTICPAASVFLSTSSSSHRSLSLSLSLSQMCNISQHLLLTSCTFLPLPLSRHLHSLLPFWYPPLPKSPPASMNTSLVSPPHIYLLLIWISRPLSLSPSAYLSFCICSLPESVGSALIRRGCRGRNEPEMVNCLFLTARRLH